MLVYDDQEPSKLHYSKVFFLGGLLLMFSLFDLQ